MLKTKAEAIEFKPDPYAVQFDFMKHPVVMMPISSYLVRGNIGTEHLHVTL